MSFTFCIHICICAIVRSIWYKRSIYVKEFTTLTPEAQPTELDPFNFFFLNIILVKRSLDFIIKINKIK